MAKRFVQDVVPSGRRSIRNIPLPESRGGESEVRASDSGVRARKSAPEASPKETRAEKSKSTPKTSKRSSRWLLWLVGIIVLLGAIYAVSYIFVSASVTIAPKEVTTPASVAGTAVLDPSTQGLAYTIVTLEREGSKEVPASGEEKVEKKASGRITIYNNAGTAPQQLVANTRFESNNGLIYRIQSAATVPGAKTVNGVTTPGSLTVTVYADQAGEKYNINLSDFTIPGFKGDPKYTKITAKSDPASPISGGYIGTAKKVAAADLASAKVSIEADLKTSLQDMIQTQIPDTHVLFKNASTFSYTELPQGTSTKNSSALIREKGTMYGILFERKALSKFLADKLAIDQEHGATVANLEDLSFTLDNLASFNPNTTKEISFKLSGTAEFVWDIDSNKIAESLAGQKRAKIKDILGKFEEVSRANVSIKPIWVITMPRNPEKIKVQLDQAE